MAEEKKTKTVISASSGKTTTASKPAAAKEPTKTTTRSKPVQAAETEKPAARSKPATVIQKEPASKPAKQRATGLRILAVVLWLLAIGAEVVAFLILNETIYTGDNQMIWLIAALAVDLVLVIIGSQLWKKSNHIDPASEKNKIKFWLWNNMGVIVSIIAFVPIIILMIKDEKLDMKSKRLAVIAGAVALLIAVPSSVDWNPVSEESLAEANAQVEGITDDVYWTHFGRKYHLSVDCSSLSRSAEVYAGTVDQAFEESRNDLCKICAKTYGIEVE